MDSEVLNDGLNAPDENKFALDLDGGLGGRCKWIGVCVKVRTVDVVKLSFLLFTP